MLRVHTSEPDQCDGKPFHEAVALKAQDMSLRGAAVLRSVIGNGSDIHTGKALDLSMDLLLVAKIIDDGERINAFLPVLDGLVATSLVTLDRDRVLRYGPPPQGEGGIS